MSLTIYCAKSPNPALKGIIREIRPVWALEELKEPYDIKILNPATGETKEAWYLAINPFGKIPSLKDGDFTLFESAAICTYLGDKFNKLVPAPKTQERALYDQWTFAAMSTFEPHTARIFAADYFFEKNDKTAHIRSLAVKALEWPLKGLENELSRHESLVGNSFSFADLIMTSVLNFSAKTDLYADFPKIRAYLEKNCARPAYKRAYELNGGA